MHIFLFIYTVLILALSGFTLVLVPRSLRDLGQERQRLKESFPAASFDKMVDAGYRLNIVFLSIEILYYYLLLRYSTDADVPYFFWGASLFGPVHVAYLIAGRVERSRLKGGGTRTRAARIQIWVATALTFLELLYLAGAAWLLF